MCVPCPHGCLSCIDCYRCRLCRPELVYDPTTERCIELCGDGKKFKYECDDGNNVDGDGCSRDCRVEQGYTCTGGSPESKDICYLSRPKEIAFQLIGQIRQQSSIVLNVKVNYIPQSLILSSECSSNCSSIINAIITSGDTSFISVSSKYVPGSKYLFVIAVQFGRPYIGAFDIQIGINQSQSAKYFGSISTARILNVTVNPAYLSTVNSLDRLT